MSIEPKHELAQEHFDKSLAISEVESLTGHQRGVLKIRRHRNSLRMPVPASAGRGTKPYGVMHVYEVKLHDTCTSAGIDAERAADFFMKRVKAALLEGGQVDFALLSDEFTKRDATDLQWWLFGVNRLDGALRDQACRGALVGSYADILKTFVAVDVTTLLNEIDQRLFGMPDIHAGEQVV